MRRIGKRIHIWMIITVLFVIISIVGMKQIYTSIPDHIYLEQNKENPEEKLKLSNVLSLSETIPVSGSESYTVTCNLFHLIPIKDIQVHRVSAKKLGISGNNIGIYMEYDGLLVINLQEMESIDGKKRIPADGLLKKGDYIKKVDGNVLETKEDLVSYMEKNQGETLTLEIQREEETFTCKIEPAHTIDGSYKLGIWVRDDTQGIGTLTYVDTLGNYGALGHGICDMDGSELLELNGGELYHAEIISIKKGIEGTPGELSGVIVYDESKKIGSISENTECGIYGCIDTHTFEQLNLEWHEIAYKEDLKTGSAQIRCSIGKKVESYDIEIEEIALGGREKNKNFTFRVVDEQLLKETGGIVQGLSGSPIIQDGKLVGAVTHVLVNDPTRGYGIFIENMLEAAE